jgi:hypothetical protein
MSRGAWARLLWENRRAIYGLFKDGARTWRIARKQKQAKLTAATDDV